MITRDDIKDYWESFKSSTPGRRFEDFYERRQEERKGSGLWQQVAYMAAGVFLVGCGAVFLIMPGPGLLVIALGLALFAGELRFMARFLDKVEIWLRNFAGRFASRWRKLSPCQRAMGWCLAGLVLLTCAGAAYEWMF